MTWDIYKMAWLRRYREAVMRIDDRVEELLRLKALTEPGAQKISDMPGGGVKRDWTDTVAALIELEDEIRAECDEFKRIRAEVMDAINAVQDARYRSLLDKRYIGCKTWEQIADEMYCDYKTALNWHGAALEMLVMPDA